MVSQKLVFRVLAILCLTVLLTGAASWTGSHAQAIGVLQHSSPSTGWQGDFATWTGLNQPAAPQGGGVYRPGAHFLHGSQASNITGFTTSLDHPLLNQEASVLFIATQHSQPNGLPAYLESNNPIGVYWNAGQQRWAVMYENTAMLADRAFNIYVPPIGWAFTHTTTVSNTEVDLTLIDDPRLNGHPEVHIFALHNYSLSNSGVGAIHNHNIGVYYDDSAAKWGIYNLDRTAMPAGMVFNVALAQPGDIALTHVAAPGNIASNYTILDDPGLNGNPNLLLTATPVFNSVAFDYSINLRYDTLLQKWTILAAGAVSFPSGAAFNLLATPAASGAFVHIVTTQNIHPTYNHLTALDHPYLNGNPDAMVFANHVLNSPSNPGHQLYYPHPFGVTYIVDTFHPEGRWYIYSTDTAAIGQWEAFNVYYTSPQSYSYSMENMGSGSTTATLNYPLLNSIPGSDAQLMPNFNPNGHSPLSGYSYPFTVGFRYNSGFWQISRPSGPNLPQYLSYNVMVPKANLFTHITSALNIPVSSPMSTEIDNPLINNKPFALVFVTPNGSPSGLNHSIDEVPIGVYYNVNGHWAIYNEASENMVVGEGFNYFVVPRSLIYLPQVQR